MMAAAVPAAEAAPPAILEARGIGKSFGHGPNALVALRNVSFSLTPGRALAIVGESGSGKTTCARILTRIYEPTAGSAIFKGNDIAGIAGRQQELAYRRSVQMIFQDPFAALNPTRRIAHHLARPLRLHRKIASRDQVKAKIAELLSVVELDPAVADRFPHQLSGGQRQRVCIARTLAVAPEVVIADEPTSMLDVSIRLGILKLLSTMKQQSGLAMLYITHDIATAAHVAEEVMVMFAGQAVEWGDVHAVIETPTHPYTQLLLSAVPDPDRPFKAGTDVTRAVERVRAVSRVPSDDIRQIGPNHFIRVPPDKLER